MRRERTVAVIFFLGALVYIAALAWATRAYLRVEDLRAEASERAAMRLALWRMEARIAPRFVREATRPWFEWEAFHPQERVNGWRYRDEQPREFFLPSPLLGYESSLFPLHFQWHPEDGLSSPQVPRGRFRMHAERTLVAPARIAVKEQRLAVLDAAIVAGWNPGEEYDRAVARLEIELDAPAPAEPVRIAETSAERLDPAVQSKIDAADATARRQLYNIAQQEASEATPVQRFVGRRAGTDDAAASDESEWARSGSSRGEPQIASAPADVGKAAGERGAPPPGSGAMPVRSRSAVPGSAPSGDVAEPEPETSLRSDALWLHGDETDDATVSVGPLIACWVETGGAPEAPFLVALRRVEAGSRAMLQGVVIDWTTLVQELSAELVGMDLPVTLRPLRDADREGSLSDRALASVPVVLGSDRTRAPAARPEGMFRTIVLVWTGALAALGLAGFAVLSSLRYGSDRARFASALTHELRTPLTTFRLYTEMLDEGLVPEQERAGAVQTLRGEAERLSLLVSNMLAYARLERGGHVASDRGWSPQALLDEILPPMRDRARRAERPLVVKHEREDGPRLVRCDAEVVGRILLNLVDNACKYALPHVSPEIVLSLSEGKDRFMLRVRDFGPGIDVTCRRSVFHPFDRGAHRDDAVPGIGLGLALSRGLARRQGGDLILEEPAGEHRGAVFRLELPFASE